MSKNKKTAAAKPKQAATIPTIQKANKAEFIVVNILCLFIFLAFGYIGIMSFFETSVFDQTNLASELVIFEGDNIILNLFFTALFIALLFWLRRFYDFFAKVSIRILEIGLAVWTAILGVIWIYSVTSVPAADSANLFEAATNSANDDYSKFFNNSGFYFSEYYNGHNYFHFFPFQLGFVFFSEIVYRIFGTDSSMPVQIINVLSLASAYFALARITALLFKRKSIEFIAILLLAVCFQPVFLCTFVYGNIIGMSTAVWACLFLIKYFQTNRWVWIIPAACLLMLSTIVKYNNLIYLVAFVIMLILHAVKNKKWQSLAFALAMCILCVGSSKLIIMSYEARANTQFESGLTQTMYFDLGLQESPMAPGWYTKTAVNDYMKGGFDAERGNAVAQTSIDRRLEEMSDDLGYAFDFFGKKILSQWNEPSYESIWISQVKQHSHELSDLAKDIYNNGFRGQLFALHFNFYMQILFVLFALGIYLLFIDRKTNIETVLLPLVLLGAFGYHLLFEAKSQYACTYIPLLVPTAAYAMNKILFSDYAKIRQLVEKINKKHSKTKA
ncbi:MAG: glycosyltransferase family 39 protein [Ruminococcus sp.]|nr:glycosyltransferase family 39 protein [uncultured Ruminococcus sp.]MBQ4171073.1 glycosyltransferase family 39 protein [Ruminococcus sp.]MBQ4261213.1 glycosyltransferase family 39 protein [Ruminococcus sp.]